MGACAHSEKKYVARQYILRKAAKIMMKKGPDNAVLSQMHMMGMGTKFMKQLMKQHNLFSLKEFMGTAQDLGVQVYTCEKMMGVMGITKEELADEAQTMSWKIGSLAYHMVWWNSRTACIAVKAMRAKPLKGIINLIINEGDSCRIVCYN